MMMKSLSLISALSFSFIAASALPQSATANTYVVHESRLPGSLSYSWKLSSKAPEEQFLPLRIGLKQSNMDRLEEELMAVSHPTSTRYGQHWTSEQVGAFFRPSEETHLAVMDWLNGAGFGVERVNVVTGGHWFEVKMTVAEAEKLLRSEYHVYEHETGTKHIACNSYSVPAHIQPHIDLITPTIHFDAIHHRPSPHNPQEQERRLSKRKLKGVYNLGQPGAEGQGPKVAPGGFTGHSILNHLFGFEDLEDCDKRITPACLRALYNIYLPFGTLSGKKNSYGIVEFTPQAYVPSDLDLFFKNYSKSQVGQRPKLVSIDGGVNQQDNMGFVFNGEANLDLDYAMALVGPNQPVTLYQVGDLQQGASFGNFLDALDGSYCTFKGGDDPSFDGVYPNPAPGGYKKQDCGTVKPANVISVSYGYNEADLSNSYIDRQCAEYGKLGMMGVSMIFSSGDFGVAGNGDNCLNSDGSQSPDGKRFNPGFPSGCPFVTSVGATQVNPGSTVFDPEAACEQVIFSGGGFSNYFNTPDYQKKAVASYFANHNPPYTSARYNNSKTSRGYPDISANGANYVVAVDGKVGLVYGTSAAAPVVGAMITLVNDVRLAIGKSPVGFINPMLYSDEFSFGLKDITSGRNNGCGTNGFEAVQGWDPVTGLGTPNFPLLLANWLAAP